ncbi:MAG: hypothetical protein ACRD34_04245 [Bryobacteraceae bacterium]
MKFLLPLAVLPLLAAQLSAPKAGNVRYADGGVRAIYGFDADFVLGPSWTKASTVAFSEKGGILALLRSVELVRPDLSVAGEYPTSDPHPLLGIGDGLNTAIAWLPSSGALVWWTGSRFQTTPLAGVLPGTPTSLQSDGATATFLVTAPDGSVLRVSVDLASGDIDSADVVPGARGPAYAEGRLVVFRNHQGLAIEQPNGAIRTLPYPAPDLQIEHMSSGWLHIHSAALNRDWALHLTRSVCALWRLPEPEAGQ